MAEVPTYASQLNFGALLRRHRTAAGISQEELAERAGLSRRGIADLERGARQLPYAETIQRVVDALELEPNARADLFAAVRRARSARAERTETVDTSAAAPRPTNLPAHIGSLIGRAEAITTITDRLLTSESGLVTLTGAGGSGKTHLAIAVGSQLLEEFPDGVWLVELASLTDPALVPETVAACMGVVQQPGRSTRDTLLERLRDRTVLLILDNCEHVVDACADLVVALLESCRGLRILATSREPLRTPKERTWRVPTLPVPDPERVQDIAVLSNYASVQLFVERAQAVQPEFQLTPRNGPSIAAICARLDGLPLAIELAAARARVLSAQQIVARLDDAFSLLVGGSRTTPTRQQTMRATLDWSFHILGSAEQSLFRRTAVFAGGFDLEALEVVCAGGDLSGADLVELLTALVDRSLILAEDQDNTKRYRLLEPLRQYANEQLVASREWETIRHGHAAYFLSLAEEAEPRLEGPEQKPWMLRLDREHDNVRVALRRSLDAGEVEMALRIASALWLFWRQRGYRNEGERWLEEGLTGGGGRAVSTRIRAKALRQTAELANAQCDYARARARFAEALTLCRELDDVPGTAGTLLHYGRVLTRSAKTPEDRARGLGMLEESLELNRKIDQFWGAGWALQYIGWSAWDQAELERAKAALREGIEVLERGGGHHLRSHLMAGLGMVLGEMGDLDEAKGLLDNSLAESRATDCGEGVADALCYLAGVGRRRGDIAAGMSQCIESLQIYKRLGLQFSAAECLELLGGLACDGSQPARAVHLFAVADNLRRAIDVQVAPVHRPQLERDLARARADLGSAKFGAAWKQGQAMTFDEAIETVSACAAAMTARSAAAHPPDRLSSREYEVAALIARGWTNRQIAESLVISERTADGHVANILSKLGLKTRAQVAVWMVEQQLVPPVSASAER